MLLNWTVIERKFPHFKSQSWKVFVRVFLFIYLSITAHWKFVNGAIQFVSIHYVMVIMSNKQVNKWKRKEKSNSSLNECTRTTLYTVDFYYFRNNKIKCGIRLNFRSKTKYFSQNPFISGIESTLYSYINKNLKKSEKSRCFECYVRLNESTNTL